MNRYVAYLRVLLRLGAAAMLFGGVAVFIPRVWMQACHEWLGLGAFPEAPIAEYLARVCAGLYAILGGLLWLFSGRPRRYAEVISYTATAVAVLAVVMVLAGIGMAMPLWWLLADAASAIAFCLLVLHLQRKVRRR